MPKRKTKAEILDTTVEFWLNLDHQYRSFHARQIDAIKG